MPLLCEKCNSPVRQTKKRHKTLCDKCINKFAAERLRRKASDKDIEDASAALERYRQSISIGANL